MGPRLVRFARPAVAVLTSVPVGTLSAGDPVLVSSSLADLRSIDACIEYERRLEKDPQQISQLISEATAAGNSVLLGYLYQHVWQHEALTDATTGDRLLDLFIGNPAVPAGAYPEIVQDSSLTFNQLPADVQTKAVERLHQYAQSPDLAVAAAGFRGFAQLAEYGHKVQEPPLSALTLSDVYRKAVQRGLPREDALERHFGIELSQY